MEQASADTHPPFFDNKPYLAERILHYIETGSLKAAPQLDLL